MTLRINVCVAQQSEFIYSDQCQKQKKYTGCSWCDSLTGLQHVDQQSVSCVGVEAFVLSMTADLEPAPTFFLLAELISKRETGSVCTV